MKPTAQLRWLRRTADRHPVTRKPLYGAEWTFILQQLWVEKEPSQIPIGEWRDVPVVEETV